MNKNWFEELFINEAKPALKRHEGGGGSGGREPVVEEKTITENGVYTPPTGVDGFSKVDVDVPSIDTSEATATEADVKEGKTFYAGDDTLKVGKLYGGSSLKRLLDLTKSCYYLCGEGQMTTLEGIISFDDTSAVTDMSSMFYNCNALTTVPQFDTSAVTSMGYMFYNCKALTTVPQFDTSAVVNMSGMFHGCKALTTVPQFDTSAVVGMGNMFYNCNALTTVPQFDTSAVIDMNSMFYNCKALTTCLIRNISVNVQIGSSTAYGYLLTMESLLNLLNETRYYTDGMTRKLTVGTANLAKFTGDYEYVKLTGEIVDVDDNPCEMVDGCKVRCEWCTADAEGAMSITDYMTYKGWQIA